MELLTSLGINSTTYIHLAIFLVVFVVLKDFVFKPYFRAFVERNDRTVGQTETAEKYSVDTKALEAQYAEKAREINEQFKQIYDKTRQGATKEYDRLVAEARARSKELVEQARTSIQSEIQAARLQLSAEVPVLSELISNQLVGREPSA